MDISNQQLTLGRVIELSDLMLQSAKSQEWDSVTQMQQLRDELIYSFFDQNLLVDSNKLAENISYIIASDEEITLLAKDESSQLQVQLKKIAQGKNALRAYASI